MYKKLIKKYFLFKICIFLLPKKKRVNVSCYFFCKYLIQSTPYTDSSSFLQEIFRLFNMIFNLCYLKCFLFICSNKIFLVENLNLRKKRNWKFLHWHNIGIIQEANFFSKLSLVIWYDAIFTTKCTAFLKKQKILSIGFLDFNSQPNITDYTLLLETKFFSSIFLFHFLLKKFLIHVKS